MLFGGFETIGLYTSLACFRTQGAVAGRRYSMSTHAPNRLFGTFQPPHDPDGPTSVFLSLVIYIYIYMYIHVYQDLWRKAAFLHTMHGHFWSEAALFGQAPINAFVQKSKKRCSWKVFIIYTLLSDLCKVGRRLSFLNSWKAPRIHPTRFQHCLCISRGARL